MPQISINVRQDLHALADRFDGDVTDGFNWGSQIPHIIDAVERVFRTEGLGTWPALDERYAAWKAPRYPGAGLLVQTGAYFRAATTPGGAYNVLEVRDDGITFGVDGLAYPSAHEEGTGRLPKRPVFALLETDSELIENATQALSDFITTQLTR